MSRPASPAAPRSSSASSASMAPSSRRPGPFSSSSLQRHRLRLPRGEEYFVGGNIAAARDFFERAAEAGLAAAALRLAASYDPAELEGLQVQGVVPDRA